MGFTEAIKIEVRKKSHIACCLCKAIGVEVHHIVPQEEGGPDSIENAAPLCPTCHEIFGANPTKRKMIREARDFWYEICEKRFASDASKIDEMHRGLEILPEKVANVLFERLAASGAIKIDNKKAEQGWPLGKLVDHFYSLTTKNSSVSELDVFAAYQFLFISKGNKNDPRDTEFNGMRDEFLKTFGEQLAKRFCLFLLKNKPIQFERGFMEEEVNELFQSAFPIMFCLLRHEELGKKDLNIRSRFDGELEMSFSSIPPG